MTSEISALRLEVLRLENENEDIRRERDRFAAQLVKFRQDNGTLESQIQDLGIENNDLKRKLARNETILPPVSRSNEPTGRPSIKKTAPLTVTRDIDVIEIDEDSEDSEPEDISLPPRGKTMQTKPFVLLSLRKATARPMPGLSASTRSSGSRASSEQTASSLVSYSPSPGLVTNKRRIGQVNGASEMEKNKRKKEGQGQWRSASGGSEGPSAPGLIAGPSISAMEQRRTQRAHSSNRVASSASSTVEESPLMHVPKRQANLAVKDAALRLTDENISKYLQGCVRLNINPTPITYYFSRKFIWKTYGGSMMTLLAKSTDQSRDFIFPTPEMNPQMPTSPGQPGLLLSCRRGMLELTCTMFSRTIPKPARWEYMGEYESELAGQLSPSAFKQQTQAMKDAWTEKLLDAKKWPVYTAMRARIYLRKVGEELTDENVAAEVERITSKNSEGGPLTDGDIIRALERGDEQIDIIRMKCVSYDRRFVNDMHIRSKLPGSRTQSATSGKGSTKPKTGKPRGA